VTPNPPCRHLSAGVAATQARPGGGAVTSADREPPPFRFQGMTMSEDATILTLADAKAMVLAAESQAARIGIGYSIAVVDAGGHLLHFSRGEAGVAGCAQLAIDKAYTATMFGQSTQALAGLARPGAELYGIQHSLGGRAVVFGGGLPIRRDGILIGAIGASAGSIEQDIAVAQAGLSACADSHATNDPRRHRAP